MIQVIKNILTILIPVYLDFCHSSQSALKYKVVYSGYYINIINIVDN